MLLLILIASGCGCQKDSSDSNMSESTDVEREDEFAMEKSIKLIMEAGNLDRDSAEGTVDCLTELGVGEIESAELVSNNRGVILRVTDSENQVYYLGYGGLGYLEIVRKDSEDGEIIYAPEE